jgi:hypothetical protein
MKLLDGRKLGPCDVLGGTHHRSALPCSCRTKRWCRQSRCSQWCSCRTLRIWGPMPNLFSLLSGKRHCCTLFTVMWVCVHHVNSLVMWTPWNLDLLTRSNTGPINVDGGMLGPPFPVVHNQLLCLADVEVQCNDSVKQSMLQSPMSQWKEILALSLSILLSRDWTFASTILGSGGLFARCLTRTTLLLPFLWRQHLGVAPRMNGAASGSPNKGSRSGK